MRTLGHNLFKMADASQPHGRRRRNYFLLGIAASQILSTYFLTHY